jgi:solute carrier family 25 protein 44
MSSIAAAEDEPAVAPEIHIPSEIDWNMLDKSKFFILGAALFSGVSFALYPMVVLKTRQQVLNNQIPCFKLSISIMRNEGLRGFYRGFGTSLMGTIPARALYMGALELTKSSIGSATLKLGFSESTAAAIANSAAGLSSAMAAQLVWTPVDVVSQRLMVQGQVGIKNCNKYCNGLDALRKIMYADGVKGLYRGFGISIFTYAPSNAVWWGSYAIIHREIWEGISNGGFRADSKSAVVVQGISAAMASGVSALVTMPLDTIKTRTQVLEKGDRRAEGRVLELGQILRNLVKEEGIRACYRGLGPRWASMSISATTMVTTYEFVKRLSAKNNQCDFAS